MTTQTTTYQWRDVQQPSAAWWVLMLTGIAWIIVGVLVLDADVDSALTIGYLVGGYLIAAGVMEFVLIGVTVGWKWLHAVLGVLFVIGGIAGADRAVPDLRRCWRRWSGSSSSSRGRSTSSSPSPRVTTPICGGCC